MAIEYITSREIEDSNGNVIGKVRVIKLKENPNASVSYKCPHCGFEEKKEVEWKKPFSFKCSKCNKTIRVPSLRRLIKKKKLK